MLAAAAEAFGSPEYPVLARLTRKDLAARSSWSDKTVAKEFGDMDVMQSELISYMTDPGRAEEFVDPEELSGALANVEMATSATLAAVAQHFLDQNLADLQIRSMMALWPYASHHNREGGSEDIRRGILEVYEAFDRQVAAWIHSWMVDHDHIIRQRRDADGRPYLSVKAVAGLLTALTQGLRLRYALDPDSVDAEDLGKAYGAILASMLQLVDESPADPTPALLTELDRRRGASDASESTSDDSGKA
jgi:hypothetical protein